MPNFMNSVPLKAGAHHILFIEFHDPFLTPGKSFREFIIEVSELYILLLSTKEMNYIKFNFSCPLYLYFLLNFLYYCHCSDLNYLLLFGPSRAPVFSLHQDSPTMPSEVLLHSPSLVMPIPLCDHVLVGWLFSLKNFNVPLFPKNSICLYVFLSLQSLQLSHKNNESSLST